ncbi:peptidoglycan DD-metalloendopeptidase family protein [Candidatus Bathyarchaeota archaeon]|nr:peptidoglycan DD-metalloendopeptidase family protein [Candidatus Bathyarchaeota archaeon]MBS7628679.1 peptidoglycan DD-metalloendopeptidase family protein [Candidatus Bathyarchaeota archaeon]
MMSIAKCMKIVVYAEEDGFVSFSNSPYYAHKHLAAVDIYPKRGCKTAYSPVDGEVLEARKLRGIDDYLIIIGDQDMDVCIKILHAKPSVEVGDCVKVGDVIGETISSPFFNFWTDHHIHVEIRPIDDRVRARGCYTLDPTPIISRIRPDLEQPTTLTVTEKSDRYLILSPDSQVAPYTTPLSLNIRGRTFTLEGGLTHYGHGGLLGFSGGLDMSSLNVHRCLQVDFIRDGYIHFTCPRRRIVVGEFAFRGVSLYLNDPHVKLIPTVLGDVPLNIGDVVSASEILPL